MLGVSMHPRNMQTRYREMAREQTPPAQMPEVVSIITITRGDKGVSGSRLTAAITPQALAFRAVPTKISQGTLARSSARRWRNLRSSRMRSPQHSRIRKPKPLSQLRFSEVGSYQRRGRAMAHQTKAYEMSPGQLRWIRS